MKSLDCVGSKEGHVVLLRGNLGNVLTLLEYAGIDLCQLVLSFFLSIFVFFSDVTTRNVII